MRILFKLSVAILALMPVAQAMAADAPSVVQLRPALLAWTVAYARGGLGFSEHAGRG